MVAAFPGLLSSQCAGLFGSLRLLASTRGETFGSTLIPRLASRQSWPQPQMTLACPGPRALTSLSLPHSPEPRDSSSRGPPHGMCVLGEETVAGFKFFQSLDPQER